MSPSNGVPVRLAVNDVIACASPVILKMSPVSVFIAGVADWVVVTRRLAIRVLTIGGTKEAPAELIVILVAYALYAVPVLPGVGVCTMNCDVPVPVDCPDFCIRSQPALSVAHDVAPPDWIVREFQAALAAVLRL